ncbi:CapA family protein [Patescibacteria group bacterium]|nr:CapA family protein [Patescibacteria group bacterium]
MIKILERALVWVLLGMILVFLTWFILFARELYSIKASFDYSVVAIEEMGKRLAIIEEERVKTTLVFVGDIMLSRAVGTKMSALDDYKYPFMKTAEFLKSADLAFGNLETPISSQGKNQGSIYSFRSDPRVIEGLTYSGFDVLSLANNHIWDWGATAMLDTISLLEEAEIRPVGAGADYAKANQPALFTLNKQKIAITAYTNLLLESLQATSDTSGLSDFNLDKIKAVVNELKKEENLVIVSLHWGEEYAVSSNELQRAIARELVDAGVDIVVGHHPHVVQELEHYKDGWIAYSLGNFIFDQTFSEETMRGAALQVEIVGGDIVTAKLLPVEISPFFQADINVGELP